MTESSVLVVEDEQGLADLYAAWMGEGYRVRTADSGETALDRIDGEVDAVLLDRRLPGLSGPEVLTAMRDRGFDVPVAIVSAVRADLDIIDMPCDMYLHKPIDRETLEGTVERLVALSGRDPREREALALSAKKETLDAVLPPERRQGSSAYANLVEELADIEDNTTSASDRSELRGLATHRG